ncbi:hypothetical protein TcasGA2_TC033114 [Tribolium castaneum]|uniref:Uncharacterized protein n=1 Tax=Tribolium castaneum TaxID=7070 RepID=A0A139WGS4_TRICA|nr:hypothetical protein TcasGA2_TC033114 [Tribolium castaneum]
MLDTQFSSQNGAGAPGISFIVAPPGAVTPEQNKWVAHEPPRQEGKTSQDFQHCGVLFEKYMIISNKDGGLGRPVFCFNYLAE